MAVQDNTAPTAAGGDQAGAGSLLTTPPAGDEAQKPDQAAAATDNDGQADGDKQTEDKDAKAGAPEKYEFQLPEGMEMDDEALAEFEPIARELNLSNEQAQKFADLYAKRMDGIVQRQQEAVAKQLETWVSEVKADKEIGGQNLDSTVRYAQAAINKFGTEELKSAMNATGIGNHPELVRVFARIGKSMAEDKFLTSGPSGKETDPAKKLFPSMP